MAELITDCLLRPPVDAGLVKEAEALGVFVRRTIIDDDGVLYNHEHQHLRRATIGWLWSSEPYHRRGRRILGEARMAEPTGTNAWSKARTAYLWHHLFGHMPDFVITLDAEFFSEAETTDAECLAVVEHELYHCAQAVTLFGSPRFRRDGGPIWCIRPHDVEEFVGVVRRYGSEASGVKELVEVAGRGATVVEAKITQACATCLR